MAVPRYSVRPDRFPDIDGPRLHTRGVGAEVITTVQEMSQRIVWLELHRALSQFRIDQVEGELLVLKEKLRVERLRAAAAAAQAPEYHNIAGRAG
jgi:hypothetical protein